MAFLGFVLWEFVRLGIDRRIAEETASADESDGDEGGAGGTRVATLLPLLRGVFQIGLLVVGGLIILSELGINIGPLLAGAGVAGIAVGFSAQTLVRDIFSGVFFLIDDAFRVGEYIETGTVKGTVEKISIRSMQLRHH